MKKLVSLSILIAVILISGCATVQPISDNKNAWIYMMNVPVGEIFRSTTKKGMYYCSAKDKVVCTKAKIKLD